MPKTAIAPMGGLSIHVRWSPRLQERLDREAEREGIGRSDAVRQAITEWCAVREQRRNGPVSSDG